MTREELIEQAGMEYAEEMVLQVDPNTNLPIFRRCKQLHFSGYDLEEAFDAGAQWADKTMIDKAVEWLKSHGGFTIGFDGATVIDFLKAMEG